MTEKLAKVILITAVAVAGALVGAAGDHIFMQGKIDNLTGKTAERKQEQAIKKAAKEQAKAEKKTAKEQAKAENKAAKEKAKTEEEQAKAEDEAAAEVDEG